MHTCADSCASQVGADPETRLSWPAPHATWALAALLGAHEP